MHPVPQQPRSRERGGPSPRFLSPAAGGKVVGGLGEGIGREEKSCHISRYRKDRRSVGRFGRGREAPQRRQKVEKLLSLSPSLSSRLVQWRLRPPAFQQRGSSARPPAGELYASKSSRVEPPSVLSPPRTGASSLLPPQPS